MYRFYASEIGGLAMLSAAFIAGIGFYLGLGRSKDITEGWTKRKT